MGKCIIIKKITSKGGVSESVQNQVNTMDYTRKPKVDFVVLSDIYD